MKKILSAILLLFTIVTCGAKSPKYIFYFIGDGMGFSHVQMTQGALAARDQTIGFAPLGFTTFPVCGWATTHCATRLTTDSAAAGTALASGEKTSVETIGMNTDHSANLESIAVKAKAQGRKVGVLTTVSIDHATPAAFYAHVPDRNQYTEIAAWIPKAGFDLYAGSGLIGNNPDSIYNALQKQGYTIVRGKKAQLSKNKTVWVQEKDKNAGNLPLAIDRKPDDITLTDLVEKSIEYLKNSPKGFFIMAEGGQIDWAAHSNDAGSITHEVLDFDQAIKVAIEFYNTHPEETLIVITADHETGGLTLGRGDRGYDTNLEKLFDQKGSKDVVGNEIVKQIHHDAGVAFTSGKHTAAIVPVFAIGQGAEQFNGAMDNTDIPKRMLQVMQDK